MSKTVPESLPFSYGFAVGKAHIIMEFHLVHPVLRALAHPGPLGMVKFHDYVSLFNCEIIIEKCSNMPLKNESK